MNDAGHFASLTNVFVLMLENHSFDNIFAMSGLPGIKAATDRECNSYTPPGCSTTRTYCVNDGAPPCMTTDPGHEFEDVLEQLCGVAAAKKYEGGAYPPVNNSGFASNYATSYTENTGTPTSDRIGDIMACFHTETQLPVIHRLATEFAICDNWFSSIPGPTWPNRFFVHGGSAANWADSPSTGDEIPWFGVPGFGFSYEKGSIFQALSKANHQWRLYQDKWNRFSGNPSGPQFGGWISQVASLKGITLLDVHSLDRFASDLQEREKHTGRPSYLKYPYTFIEPNFGKSFFAPQDRAKGYLGPTYKGGSSQHPEDDPSGGEGLIKAVYEAIRKSPVWNTSLLVIVYDEHGGFYDSAKPGPATPPGDKSPWLQRTLNRCNFDFTQYGVRVPAVVVSPLIPKSPKGTVDHTLYDHTSILKTLEKWLGMEPLTKRDEAANDLGHLLTLSAPRSDCPYTLPSPVRWIPTKPVAANRGEREYGK